MKARSQAIVVSNCKYERPKSSCLTRPPSVSPPGPKPVLLILLIILLIEADTHGDNDRHIHARRNCDNVRLLVADQIAQVERLLADLSHGLARRNLDDLRLAVQEVALHLELHWLAPAEGVVECDGRLRRANCSSQSC